VAVIVADTDVLIDSLHGKEPVASTVARQLRSGSLATTAISAFELRSGARTERARREVEILLAALHILSFDAAAERNASDVRQELEAIGQSIGMADYMIAGVCLSRSAQLLTRNRSHFSRIGALRLADLGNG
jgi:tRNA(fMet)-specific endonuclease VapC